MEIAQKTVEITKNGVTMNEDKGTKRWVIERREQACQGRSRAAV